MQGGAEGGARLGPALASTVQGLAALKEAWGETSRKGENRLTRLINAKMEMLCARRSSSACAHAVGIVLTRPSLRSDT
jgi:hypothetical protein